MGSLLKLTIVVMIVNIFKSCELIRAGTRLKACGSQLSSVLAEVCQGEYLEKRTKPLLELDDPDYFSNYDNVLTYGDSTDNSYEFRAKRSLPLLRMLKAKRETGIITGVSDECCRKSCTIQQLVGYCKMSMPSPKQIKAN